MNQAEVNLIVRARDEASRVLDGVKKTASGLGATLGNVLRSGGLLAGAGIGIAVAAGVKFIGTASDLAESISKVNVVFGKSALEVQEWATGAARNLGMSRQAALEVAGTFGNLFTAMGIGQKEARDLSFQITELGVDLSSFNNISTTDALEKLRAGLVGEAEPLRALGVNMNAAMVEAKALELGLADASGAISESAKVQARYAIILEQTKNAQGDFSRTSDGLANQQRILGAQWQDLQAQIGTALMPLMLALVSVLATHLVPAVQSAVDGFSTLGTFISAGLAGNVTNAAEAFAKLPPSLQAIALWLVENKPAFDDMIGNVRTLASEIRSLSEDVISGWIIILVALWPKLVDLGNWLNEHEQVFIALAAAIVGVAIVLGSTAVAVGAVIVGIGWLTQRINDSIEAGGYWAGVFERGGNIIAVVATVVNALTTAMNAVNDAVNAAGRAVNDYLLGVLQRAQNMFNAAKDTAYFLKDAFYSLRDAAYAVRDAINSIPNPVDKFGGILGKGVDLLPGRAVGGLLPRGFALVGESGPELLYSPSGGQRVFSNADTRAMLADTAAPANVRHIYIDRVEIHGSPQAAIEALGMNL